MEQKTKHTPGPWKAVQDRSRNLYTWYVEGAKGVVPAIARLSLIDACEEIEGNAHLIAAAPAMYEALNALVEVFPSVVKMTPYGVTMDISKIHDDAKAALAQAERK